MTVREWFEGKGAAPFDEPEILDDVCPLWMADVTGSDLVQLVRWRGIIQRAVLAKAHEEVMRRIDEAQAKKN